VEAPRWRVFGRGRLGTEPGIGESVRADLGRRGQNVAMQESGAEFGGAQMIVIHASGTRMTGADPRREAYGIAW